MTLPLTPPTPPAIFSIAAYEHMFLGAIIVWREGENVMNDRLRWGFVVGLSRLGEFEIETERGTQAFISFTSRRIVWVF
jgi:hypothetical protein